MHSMGRPRRTLRALLAGTAAALVAACQRDPIVVTRTVTVHVPQACAPTGRVYGVYYGWGDFQPTVASPAQSKLFLDPGAPLVELPLETRALVLDATDVGSGERFLGATRVLPTGGVDLLLWPSGSTCVLTGSTKDATDRALTVMDDGRVLVTAGMTPDKSTPPSFVVDLARGTLAQVPLGLLNGRTRARVDAFGAGALVSGGLGTDDLAPVKTAEYFDGITGRFDRSIIPLAIARSEHGSVRMKNGDVLLVDGEGDKGVLRHLERIDVALKQSTRDNLTVPDTARRRPIVVALAAGDIMIAGGLDGSDQPVPQVEFLSADASSIRSRATLPARTRMDCAATDGGGAVCVIAPEDGDPDAAKLVNTWIVSADRTVTPARVQIDVTSVPLSDVRLLPAASGRPVLWTGKTFRRWDPWSEEFVAEVDALGSTGPNVGQPLILGDRGLLLWMEPAGLVVGRRFSARTDYTSDPLPYAVSSLEGLSPDRAPSKAGMTFTGDEGLSLPQDATIAIADLRFRDFTLDLDLRSGEGLRLVLRDDGGPDTECILPGAGPVTIRVTRRGGEVVATAAGASRTCPAVDVDARLGVALRGGGSGPQANHVRNIKISR
jgi:hypothetical protein